MIRLYIFIGLITLLVQSVFSQSEIKIYGAYNDYPGISFEYTLSKNLSVELGASFRSKNAGTWNGLETRNNNLIINGMLKKYCTNKKGKTNFFYGTYIRYWYSNHFAVNAEQLPLPTSIQSLLDSNYNVTHTTKTHKVSLGFLTGYRWAIGDRFTVGINTGIGFSFPFAYWQKEYTYNQPATISLYGEDAWLGYFNHLSLVGQLSIGYHFGKQ